MSRVQLFGVGTESESRAITAQRRVNCMVVPRQEMDRTAFALMGRPGLSPFVTSLGANPSRGMWAVNTIPTPLLFTVHGNTLYSVNNSGVTAVIGTLGTSSGNVSIVDDGTYLMLVDGTSGYYYNMLVPAGLVLIVDGNFTTTPKTVTWQDTYFIVVSGTTNQFQLSSNGNPAVWPAVNINFTGSAPGALRVGKAYSSILQVFGETFVEFWQDAGSPDFPFAIIPGSAHPYGLAAPFSLSEFDNSLAGLFTNSQGARNISRMSGFNLKKLSDQDIDNILMDYSVVEDGQGYSFMVGGHPMYVINLPTAGKSWMYDGLSNAWIELQDLNGNRFWGTKFAQFVNKSLVSDYQNGNIYSIETGVYTDNGSVIPIEVVSKHIWEDDKYLGIHQIQIDIESGVGLVSGQGVIPLMDLQVSKDGGATFRSVGFSSMGRIGEYTQRVIWRSLGAAQDWVLKLRVTDPIKTVITGASAQIQGGTF